jgi:hypothetical protein
VELAVSDVTKIVCCEKTSVGARPNIQSAQQFKAKPSQDGISKKKRKEQSDAKTPHL